MTIEQLKKGDRFQFNDEVYKVSRKFINDDKPLIAILESTNQEHRFHWEGLEIIKLEAATPPLP
jgi:hypothetical protein